jgi:hypothetical protein
MTMIERVIAWFEWHAAAFDKAAERETWKFDKERLTDEAQMARAIAARLREGRT